MDLRRFLKECQGLVDDFIESTNRGCVVVNQPWRDRVCLHPEGGLSVYISYNTVIEGSDPLSLVRVFLCGLDVNMTLNKEVTRVWRY